MLVRPVPLLNLFVVLVMLSIGLRVTGVELLDVLRNRVLVIKTLVANCILIPAIGFLLVKIFPLPSWAGMCPGNEESAGKRRRRRITPGNRWLKKTLAQAGWAASHTKNTYLASQYRRLAGHRGKNAL